MRASECDVWDRRRFEWRPVSDRNPRTWTDYSEVLKRREAESDQSGKLHPI